MPIIILLILKPHLPVIEFKYVRQGIVAVDSLLEATHCAAK